MVEGLFFGGELSAAFASSVAAKVFATLFVVLLIWPVRFIWSRIISFLRSRVFFKPLISGIWHAYNTSLFENEPRITSEEWNFKTRLGKPVVISRNKESKHLRYTGAIYDHLDGGHMIIDFARKRDGEHFTMRLVNQARTKPDANMLGLWVGRTYDESLVAGVVVVSRKPLSDSEVIEQVKQFTFDSDAFVLRKT